MKAAAMALVVVAAAFGSASPVSAHTGPGAIAVQATRNGLTVDYVTRVTFALVVESINPLARVEQSQAIVAPTATTTTISAETRVPISDEFKTTTTTESAADENGLVLLLVAFIVVAVLAGGSISIWLKRRKANNEV